MILPRKSRHEARLQMVMGEASTLLMWCVTESRWQPGIVDDSGGARSGEEGVVVAVVAFGFARYAGLVVARARRVRVPTRRSCRIGGGVVHGQMALTARVNERRSARESTPSSALTAMAMAGRGPAGATSSWRAQARYESPERVRGATERGRTERRVQQRVASRRKREERRSATCADAVGEADVS